MDSDANDAQEGYTRGTHIDMHPYCQLLGDFVLGFEVQVPVGGQVRCRLARGLTRRSIEDRERHTQTHTEMPVQMQVPQARFGALVARSANGGRELRRERPTEARLDN